MNGIASTSPALQWVLANLSQILITLVVLGIYFLLDRMSAPKITAGADLSRFREGAAAKAIRILRIIMGIMGLLVLALVWGVDFGSIAIFTGTALTLLGVAFFASWSLLSNVTAYFVLLLHPTFRRGAFIRIIDADNYTEGYISDLTLFSMKLITEDREEILYPNVLLLGRIAVINPRDRLRGVGKLPADARASPDKQPGLPEDES